MYIRQQNDPRHPTKLDSTNPPRIPVFDESKLSHINHGKHHLARKAPLSQLHGAASISFFIV
jgi:hypothetical protein